MLTNHTIKNAKPKAKSYRLHDRDGLCIVIHPTGKKVWYYRYKFINECMMKLGSYPAMSLDEVKLERADAEKLLLQGINPLDSRKKNKAASLQKSHSTFQSIAKKWLAIKEEEWTPDYAEKVMNRLQTYILKNLGQRPISELTTQELLHAIQSMQWRGIISTSFSVLEYCSRILRYAIVLGVAEHNVAIPIKDILKRRQTTNNPTLSPILLGLFLGDLENYISKKPHIKIALSLIILTFVRSGELRNAKWSEFDLENSIWTIGKSRMKQKREHKIPLAIQTIKLLLRLREMYPTGEYLFQKIPYKEGYLGENDLLNLVTALGYKGKITIHGFRGTASTILNENGFDRRLVDIQLSHINKDKTEASYNHAKHFAKRREMMQWWANYLDAIKKKDRL